MFLFEPCRILQWSALGCCNLCLWQLCSLRGQCRQTDNACLEFLCIADCYLLWFNKQLIYCGLVIERWEHLQSDEIEENIMNLESEDKRYGEFYVSDFYWMLKIELQLLLHESVSVRLIVVIINNVLTILFKGNTTQVITIIPVKQSRPSGG